MNRILYISFLKVTEGVAEGVSKKIKSQINSFEKQGFEVTYTFSDSQYMNIKTGNNQEKIFRLTRFPILNRFLLYYYLNKRRFLLENTNLIYIRHEGSVYNQKKFLKNFKKLGSKNVVLEIPTYPYDKEWGEGFANNLYFYLEKKISMEISEYIDLIATFSQDNKIYGVPCIRISNGIDFQNTPIIKKSPTEFLTFTSVSICAPWHGVDRFLNSLEQYGAKTQDLNIRFNIVGEGVETTRLKKITNKSEYLNNVVVFHGFKSGEELDAIYNETNIAVGCLGNHRKGIYTIQALKNKEYAAKGLPMIFSEDDPGLRNKEYVYKASHDEQLLDIEDIIRWYHKLEITPEEIRYSIKDFSWDNQIKKVIYAVNKLNKKEN